MTYTEQNLAAVAKRENNQKRGYLVVNPLQGKHLPVSPGEAFRMFDALAGLLIREYEGERLLLVGFAETATSVGAAAAAALGSLYIQTTREQLRGAEYFYFSEAHSHATEQKLVKGDLDRAAEQAGRIVFIEDEITTGNTIRNITALLEQAYPGRFVFSAASLLNGMDADCLQAYADRGIRLHWLLKTCHEGYERLAEGYRGDGKYYRCNINIPAISVREERITAGYQDARRLTDGGAYREACRRMGRTALELLKPAAEERFLVVGTEEFMYPALMLARLLEEGGHPVRCHSTTRSPIAVSSEEGYPLHERYELRSLYDRERTTYVYELAKYDRVCIVTDAQEGAEEGLHSLINALASCGNERIHVIRWCPS